MSIVSNLMAAALKLNYPITNVPSFFHRQQVGNRIYRAGVIHAAILSGENALAGGQEGADPLDAGKRLNKQCIVFMLFVTLLIARLGAALK